MLALLRHLLLFRNKAYAPRCLSVSELAVSLDSVQDMGSLSNKFGIREFGVAIAAGRVREVQLLNKLTSEYHTGQVHFLPEEDLRRRSVRRILLRAAERTVRYVSTFHRAGLGRHRASSHFFRGWTLLDDSMLQSEETMFAVITHIDVGGERRASLAAYALGTVNSYKNRFELNFVETSPLYEGQGIAKVLSTYVLSNAAREMNQAYVRNLAGLVGALAYLPAAANAGFTHVRVEAFPETGDPVRTAVVRLVRKGKFVGTVKTCRAMRLAAWRCSCSLRIEHCFGQLRVLDFIFYKRGARDERGHEAF